MRIINNLEILKNIQIVRSWSKKNLPLYESAIANDLVVFLAIEFLSGRPLTVKRLFASLPYSYTAIRQHYKKLFEDGWITSTTDVSDKRIKYLVPSDKFIKAIDSYAEVVETAFR